MFQSLLAMGLKRVLLGAGLGLASYATFSTVLRTIILTAASEMRGGSAVALSYLALGGADVALSLIFSAVLVRSTMMGAKLSLVQK
ncbi:MAG: protein of unknown function DUF2523 [Inoviridae sp.]|nr:MAG: protein of unknown function DUF2523 [Inoviridae sp.]